MLVLYHVLSPQVWFLQVARLERFGSNASRPSLDFGFTFTYIYRQCVILVSTHALEIQLRATQIAVITES